MKPISKKIEEMDWMVTEITGIGAEDLAKIKFQMAYQYLEDVIADTYGIEWLPKYPQFWQHWKLLWYHIDFEILIGSNDKPPVFRFSMHEAHGEGWFEQTVYGLNPVTDWPTSYLHYHEASHLGWQLKGSLIEESFHLAIKDIAKNKYT